MSPAAARFRALHAQPGPLLLPNAWDAPSARVFAMAGAQAVATSSAALSWAQGCPDGGRLSPERLVEAVSTIARGLETPLSVDVEDGLHDSPGRVADLVEALAELGVAGVNIEDGDASPQHLVERIALLRSRGRLDGVFLNARTDVVLRALVPPASVVEEVLARAHRYAEAGADGLFVPGLVDMDAIRAIVDGCRLPLNLMWVPGLPGLQELAELGVRRISSGPAHFLATYAGLLELAGPFLSAGTGPASGRTLDYAAMNAMFD